MKKKTFLAGAAIGAVIGAAAAILLAPKSGKQTRADIKNLAKEMSGKIIGEVEKAKSMTKDKYEKIVDGVVAEYKKKKKTANKTLDEINKELKARWRDVQKELKMK
ncbi:MAG TPA: YtxH domain-containing protein [Candidatus Bipolaricaulota bacterium]|nr:YtxH domain-containing protein [Candidatus Bipolaricaulota bacterium]